MKTTKLCVLLMVLVSVLAFGASALPLHINSVEVEDVVLSTSEITSFAQNRGDKIQVEMVVTSSEDLKDVQLEAVMRGYDHNDLIEDITEAFDMKANVTYKKYLTLTLPIRMDKDQYKLRIRAEDRNGDTTQIDYEIQVESKNHEMLIKDVVFSPENYIMGGRALLTTVRIKNIGMKDEDGIKVKVSIPGLGVSASDYIDQIDTEESTTSEELYLRIPPCAVPGEYNVNVELVYDDGDETETKTSTIMVTSGDVCPTKKEEQKITEKTIISIGTTSQKVNAGEGGAIYPITLTNQGASTKTYMVSVDVPGEWATYQMSPSNVAIVKAGETSTVYVYISAKETAQAGENMFSVSVSSGDETLKQVPLKATVGVAKPVVKSGLLTWDRVKRALEIGLVVLVVLLIVLGLIIGFNKLKGDGEEENKEEDMGKTYY